MTEREYIPSKRPELFEDAEQDPYVDDNLDEYPDWWTENILEFNRYGLRPYRPPRFSDGVLTTELIQELSAALDVKIRLRSVNPQSDDRWEILIDNTPVDRIGRYRDGDGYTVYAIESQEFEGVIFDAVRS